MDYPKSVPNVGLVDGQFIDENAATGQVGSLIPSSWGNSVTQEILNVIKAAGLAPSEGDVSQLLKAIQTVAASDIKRTVQCATTGPIALSGLQTIDGVVLTAGKRVLVKDQANAAQNWIYTVAAGAWVRALDANESVECAPGHLVIVEAGTANAGSIWQLANTTEPVLGTTALTFVRVFGKTGVAAGDYRKVSVDAQGRVTAGSNPTTLGGYGITDAQPYSEYLNALNNAGGWGLGTNVPTAPGNSWDGVSASRTSFVKGVGPNGVTIFSGLHMQVDDNRYFDIAARIDQLCFRTYEGSGAANWRQVWHSGNFDPDQYARTNLQATDAAAGLAKIANNNQMLAGTDDATIVTPKKLRLGFSSVFGENGYIAFPSWLGGFIIQWGTTVDDGATRTFPTAFPTECFCLLSTINADSFGGGSLSAYIVSRTQFRLREGTAATASMSLRYIALGN